MDNEQIAKTWSAVAGAIVVVSLAGFTIARAQQPNYDLNDGQKARLELAQQKALRANDQLQMVQGQLNQAVATFNAECDKVKAENHLPKEAACDINAPDKITPPKPAQAAAPTPEKKK